MSNQTTTSITPTLIFSHLEVDTFKKAVKFDTTCHECGHMVKAGTGRLVKLTTLDIVSGRVNSMWAGSHDPGACQQAPPSNVVAFNFPEYDDLIFIPVFHRNVPTKRAGKCANCGAKMDKGEGLLGKGPDGKFFARHQGECP